MLGSSIFYLFSILTLTSCHIYSFENEDGSYSIGLNSDSRSETANSVLALLSKSNGYTIDEDYESKQPQQKRQTPEALYQNPKESNLAESRNLLSPHLEILQLIEVFLKFKGEIASRIHALISDNSELIYSIYQTVISKIGTLHSFTLTGIKIVRKVLELAISLMAQWQINIPGLSLDVNVGSGVNAGQSSSFSFNKNSFFGRK